MPPRSESSRSPASAIPQNKSRVVWPPSTVNVPDVSIITVNWNACEATIQAVESIYDHVRGVTFELIVVDNGSTLDDSATVLPLRFPAITFIANPRNRGFSAANNQAL